MTKQLKEGLITDLGLSQGKRGILGRAVYQIAICTGPAKSDKDKNRELKHRIITNRLMGI